VLDLPVEMVRKSTFMNQQEHARANKCKQNLFVPLPIIVSHAGGTTRVWFRSGFDRSDGTWAVSALVPGCAAIFTYLRVVAKTPPRCLRAYL